MRGYYGRPEETAQFMDADGWCRSGDVAYYDEEGKVYFVERLKEMIRCMDNQVVPGEIEDLLMKHHDGIREVAVVGLPHQEYGEVAAAFVVLKNSHNERKKEIEEELKSIVAGSCAVHKHLYGGVHFVDSLPKTETGKVQKKALLPQHRNG
uniref:Putative acyl-coa synthetase n=2 Tax=Ixodes ricinus TaxID=34613 RepID=A0A147BFU3_IXORI